MNYEELVGEFESVMSEYTSLHNQHTQHLRELLIKYNNNNTKYEYLYLKNTYTDLSNAIIEELTSVFADIKQKHNIKQNTNVQDMFRTQQTSLNPYDSDNPYPHK